MARTWEYQGDVDVLGYGGTFIRHIAGRRFHAIRFDNMDEACGSDNEGHPRYYGSLVEVDLDIANVQAAADSWCEDASEHDDLALAFMVASYGEYAPLHDEASNNGNKVIRTLKRTSREIEGDSARYEALMERPVNGLGSTAREFQRGDFQSAIQRGLQAQNATATVMAKMSRQRQPMTFGSLTEAGLSEQVQVDLSLTGSDDPLAFAFGFGQGLAGTPISTDPDLAPEYVRGHEAGTKARESGELPAFASR